MDLVSINQISRAEDMILYILYDSNKKIYCNRKNEVKKKEDEEQHNVSIDFFVGSSYSSQFFFHLICINR